MRRVHPENDQAGGGAGGGGGDDGGEIGGRELLTLGMHEERREPRDGGKQESDNRLHGGYKGGSGAGREVNSLRVQGVNEAEAVKSVPGP